MTAFRRVGGPYAITAWSVLLPGILWPLTTWSNPRIGGTAAQWAAIGGASLAATAVVLVVARLVALPSRPRPERPWLALAVFALAGATHGVISEWLRVELGIDGAISPGRIALRIALAVTWLGLIAMAVDETRRHRDVVRVLAQRIAEQRDVERIERSRLDAIVREVRAEAVAPVLAALERIRVALDATAGAESETAARFSAVIERQVRPASHRLLEDEAGWAPPAVLEAPPSLGLRLARIAAAAGSRPSLHPWIAALAFEANVAPLLAAQGERAAVIALNAVLGTAILGAGAALANRLVASRLGSARPATRLATVIGTSVAIIAVGDGMFFALTSVISDTPGWYPITMLTFPLLVVIVNVAAGVGRDRRAEEERLALASRQVEWSVARIAQRVRHERRILGAWLHGPMQGALLAVAARLERAEAAGLPAAIAAALPELAQVIDAAERLLAGEAPDAAIDLDALDDVIRMWQGVLDVGLVLESGIDERVTADPSALTVAVDVIAEALANAVRHGGASTAEVRLATLPAPDRLRIAVADDGDLAEEAVPGMGSRMLDAVALEWSRTTRADGWTVLDVVTPLGPAPATTL